MCLCKNAFYIYTLQHYISQCMISEKCSSTSGKIKNKPQTPHHFIPHSERIWRNGPGRARNQSFTSKQSISYTFNVILLKCLLSSLPKGHKRSNKFTCTEPHSFNELQTRLGEQLGETNLKAFFLLQIYITRSPLNFLIFKQKGGNKENCKELRLFLKSAVSNSPRAKSPRAPWPTRLHVRCSFVP